MKRKRIIYVQYTNPAAYPPLQHSSQILAEAGWNVLFLGTGALGTDKLRFEQKEHIEVRRMRFQSPGVRQKLHYALFNLWCIAWFLRWRPDWVYCSELSSCPVGLLAALAAMRTIFHEHDVPPPNASGFFGRCLYWSRRQLARRATLCVVPSEKRGEHLLRSTGASRTPAVVWNCPRSVEAALPQTGLPDGTLHVLYHGSIVPDRLPVSVVEALALVPLGVILTVVGYETTGSKGYVDALRMRARELGVGERLKVEGAVSRHELMRMCRLHDVGLALVPLKSGDPNMGSMVGPSNKPFDYLACGLAPLVSDLPDWNEIFVKPGFGLACDPSSPRSIADALNKFAAQPEKTRTMGERGRQQILGEWNYDQQFRPVLNLLNGNASDSLAQTALTDERQAGWKAKAVR